MTIMHVPDAHIATTLLAPGTSVYTSLPDGSDFGLPLVSPVHARRARCGTQVRTVRSTIREQGGTVVRFTDGSKTRPVHGRTSWLEA